MRLSIIIPTLNEEGQIKKCIESAKILKPDEIIVVDGGSSDKTQVIAKESGAQVIISDRGRGTQLQKGASSSSGDILLFLHADAVISEPFDIRSAIKMDNVVGGFFRLKFDAQSTSIRLVELFANLRARLFSLPYGDQAIFVRRDIFEEIGGFKDYPFLEDIDMVLRLRKKGKLLALSVPVIVSSRRLKKGFPLAPIFVSLRNVVIALLFMAGISPLRLIKLYK